MNKINKEKVKILYEVINEVEDLKNSTELKQCDINLKTHESEGDFEHQNDKVFYINLYVLYKLYEREFYTFKEKQGRFEIDDYYNFIESLNLPIKINELYMNMPLMHSQNKILSYVTDLPSFMGMIKD